MSGAWDRRVASFIGPLLDEWEHLPNDVRGQIEEEAPALAAAIERLMSAAEDEPAHPPAVEGES